jgi:hypothetical protein
LPKFADVCVGCNVYRLFFAPDEAAQLVDFNPEEDDLLGDDGGNGKEEDLVDPDHEMDEQIRRRMIPLRTIHSFPHNARTL